jgi:type II secretory pathway component PulF
VISFQYHARSPGGAAIEGTIEALDRERALQGLAERGLFPTRLEAVGAAPAGSAAAPPSASPADSPRAGRITRREITAFTRELATLLGATIPIPAALQGLGDQEANPAFKDVILHCAAFVRAGNSLSAALGSYPRLFSKLYVSMVEAGEESGALGKVLNDLANLLEREEELRGEVVGAVAYPCFVLGLGMVTTFILLVFVLPPLFAMLRGLVQALPLPTRVLLGVSEFFQNRWPVIIAGVAAAAVLARLYLRSAAGAFAWDRFKVRMPVLGVVFRAWALGRFARTLGTLAENGVSLLPALAIARNTVGNRFYARSIEQVAEETRGGDSLATPLRKLDLFPPTMVQMVAVGEDTGTLPAMLLRVAAMQERIAHGHARTLISLLAPALILLVGAMVGFIVIALLLPLFQMSQSIR